MIEGFVGETKSEVAVVAFDSTVDLFQNFTEDVPAAAARLRSLKGSGDAGAAILDAVSYSLTLLERRPKSRTRVLLIVSETRDHGSRTKLDSVMQRVTQSNALIYSIAFSALRAETLRDLKGQNSAPPNAGADGMKLISLASNAMRKNTARAVAELTGGEYRSFKDKKSFDQALGTLSNHVRNRYMLSFQLKNPEPGPHVFTVRLRAPQRDTIVLGRNSYWVAGASRPRLSQQ